MKKILLIAVLASAVLFASEDANATKVLKPTQMKTMQSLEKAMETIQKGFLYNNENVVENGVKDLRKNLKDIGSFMIKNNEDKNFNAPVYAATETAAITTLGDEILKAYKSEEKDKALTLYGQAFQRCIACHKIIRKW